MSTLRYQTKYSQILHSKNNKYFLYLHAILLLFSVAGIFAKSAACHKILSLEWLLFYVGLLGILLVYAIVWQIILKHINLTVAFCNKAVTVIWGIVWGSLFFGETITVKKIVGAAIVMAGLCLVILGDQSDE